MKFIQCLSLIFSILISSCQSNGIKENSKDHEQYLTVLGVAQDAGYPQLSCNKTCCQRYYEGKESKKLITSLGLIDRVHSKKYLFEATPDIVEQTQILRSGHLDNGKTIDGVFLTHAHIGHYTGLMYFGREALGSKGIPVYVLPKMKLFLEQNGPWNQLIDLGNIIPKTIGKDSTIALHNSLIIKPFLVPHRDEYSETVGYKIEGKNRSALFIPDINKWEVWEKDIVEEVKKVDYAFLDATFFQEHEISRPISEIPHPFIQETVELFRNESIETRSKIYFIHFNHTNPALRDQHSLKDEITKMGFNFASQGMNFPL